MDRLKQLFIAIYRENAGERGAAAGAFYRYLIAEKIHPEDIDLIVDKNLIERNQKAIAHLEATIARLNNENVFFRRNAPTALVRKGIAAGVVDLNQWFILYDLMVRTWGQNGELPSNWRRRLHDVSDVTAAEIGRWEAGLSPVPREVLALVQAVPTEIKPRTANLVAENRALRRKLAQIEGKLVQERRKARPHDGPAKTRKRRSYETLESQNHLLLRLLSATNKAPPLSRDEMMRLAKDIWGSDWRRSLANLFHLTTVNINNILPSGKTGKVYNKPPAYFSVLRIVHDLVVNHGLGKDFLMINETDNPDRPDIDEWVN